MWKKKEEKKKYSDFIIEIICNKNFYIIRGTLEKFRSYLKDKRWGTLNVRCTHLGDGMKLLFYIAIKLSQHRLTKVF